MRGIRRDTVNERVNFFLSLFLILKVNNMYILFKNVTSTLQIFDIKLQL